VPLEKSYPPSPINLIFVQEKNVKGLPPVKYQVYVIELSKRVFSENSRFRAANPQFNGVLECLYVGMSSKDPKERFKQHKTGYKNKKGYTISSKLVWVYGRYLRPSLYTHINEDPMTRKEALLMEEKLALDLRRQGYAVWFN
jgi:predicted GIY-YIG superfamily endonuclease